MMGKNSPVTASKQLSFVSGIPWLHKSEKWLDFSYAVRWTLQSNEMEDNWQQVDTFEWISNLINDRKLVKCFFYVNSLSSNNNFLAIKFESISSYWRSSFYDLRNFFFASKNKRIANDVWKISITLFEFTAAVFFFWRGKIDFCS